MAYSSSYSSSSPMPSSLQWASERVVDSGPLLRLEDLAARLTKAERYGHPYERRVPTAPGLSAEAIEREVVAFLRAAYHGEGGERDKPTTATSKLKSKLKSKSKSKSKTATTMANSGGVWTASSEYSTEPRRGWTWADIRHWNEQAARPRVAAYLLRSNQKVHS